MELDWVEVYEGGSREAEQEIFKQLAQAMAAVQETNRQKAEATHTSRTLHAKVIAAASNARLSVDATLP